MQRFKDLCSQDSFAIKRLHPVRCLVGSFISSLSHKQLGRSGVLWDGRKDVGMGTSRSGPGPRCMWLWGGHSTCADAELLRSGLYHRDAGTYLLPRVPNLLCAVSTSEVPARELSDRSVEAGDTHTIFGRACFLDANTLH